MSSRVDEDRQAQRVAERLAQKQREEDRVVKERANASAFSRLVQKAPGQEQLRAPKPPASTESQRPAEADHLHDDDAELTDPGEHRLDPRTDAQAKARAQARAAATGAQQGQAHSDAQGKDAQDGREQERDPQGKRKEQPPSKDEKALRDQRSHQRAAAAGNAQGSGKGLLGGETKQGMRGAELKQQGQAQAEGFALHRQGEQARGDLTAQGRKADARRTHQALDDRGQANLQKSGAMTGGSAPQGDGKVGRDSRQGGQGQQEGGSAGGEGSASFRFNPALMAPVPVARPRETTASERLRALATEIAQKIVQSVRVGVNASGESEFHIDLKSTVLKGLSIKISGGKGKIRAVFSGSDREVLKLLEENQKQLRAALEGRGLKVEALRLEVRP
jgi:hypothetical protein